MRVVNQGMGAVSSMSPWLSRAGGHLGEADYFNAPAPGLSGGDRARGLPILGGDREDPPPVPSPKSITGEECSMAGTSEIIYSALMTRDHFIGPTLNLTEVEPAPLGLSTVSPIRAARGRSGLGSSFGFWGTTASLLISEFKGTT